jgi:hypothetical protein
MLDRNIVQEYRPNCLDRPVRRTEDIPTAIDDAREIGAHQRRRHDRRLVRVGTGLGGRTGRRLLPCFPDMSDFPAYGT